jgi:hypothetical protein
MRIFEMTDYELVEVTLTESAVVEDIPEPDDPNAMGKHEFFIKRPSGESSYYTTKGDMPFAKAKELAKKLSQGGEVQYSSMNAGGYADPMADQFSMNPRDIEPEFENPKPSGMLDRTGIKTKKVPASTKAGLLDRLRAAKKEIE